MPFLDCLTARNETAFRKSFQRDLNKIKERPVLQQVRAVIESVEEAETVLDVPHLKKLSGYTDYYRIRMGRYRIGVTIGGGYGTFVRILHRRDMYRYFP